jgi:GNAT superfamily N-acetyltransferase
MTARLVRATDAQKAARDRVCHDAWGAKLSVEQFLVREERLRGHAWARENMTTWLLEDDGVVLASCETFRMESRLDGEAGHSHGVASVFTEPALRGRGYASTMMSAVVGAVRAGDRGAHAIHLYSDVGAPIYERSGFVARPAFDWVAGPLEGDPLALVDALLDEAAATVPEAPREPFVVWPTAAQLDWHLERERAYAALLSRPRPRACGARAGSSVIRWVGDLRGDRLLVMLLDAAEPSARVALLEAARRVAHEAGLAGVSVWEDEASASLFPGEPMRRAPREGSLPMILPLASGLSPEAFRCVPRALWV